jgi:hypothetical protein
MPPHKPHALGGIGKSALAAQYARGRASCYDVVGWVETDSAAQIEAGLAALAGVLRPEAGDEELEVLAERALQWLAAHDRWLLVLDNVTSPADVQRTPGACPVGAIPGYQPTGHGMAPGHPVRAPA